MKNNTFSQFQTEADKVLPLVEKLEASRKEKTDVDDEINQLKGRIEEMKHSFQQEISQIQETHRSEIETICKNVL